MSSRSGSLAGLKQAEGSGWCNEEQGVRLKQERYTGCLVVFLLGLSFLIGGMWGGLVGGGLVLWVLDEEQTPPGLAAASTPTVYVSPTPTAIISPTPTPTPVILPTGAPSVEDAIEAVLPSVVTVINFQKSSGYLQTEPNQRVVGSGIIVAEQGYIITNAHVIVNADRLSVILLNGQELPATLIIEYTNLDLALLKVEAEALAVAAWGDSTTVRLGQPVIAIGSALGDFPNSVTMGIISGLNRALALDEYVIHGLIQTDAAINQGNSGGPLINLEGEIIGINTFMIREDHNQGVAQGIGFAIPASAVKALVNTWIAQETNQTPNPLNVEEGAAISATATPDPTAEP